MLAESEGLDHLGVVQYPGAWLTDTREVMTEKLRNTVVNRIVEVLTQDRQPNAGSNAPRAVAENPREVVFRGSLEDISRHFAELKWTDQLPIIPPTIKKVEEFLKCTPLPPDKVVAVLPAGNLNATVWKIAVNAVMAGCRPQDMPILIAGVEAMSAQCYNLGQVGTTWALTPYFVVNGPIIKQLEIEYGVGLISRGPNPALGRAFGLIIRNIAGFRPGEMAMGTWGYMGPFVMAEDEHFLAQIGWKAYHEEQGFDPDTSTVTAGGTWNWGDQMTMSMVGEGFTKAIELLDAIAFDLLRKAVPTLSLRGGRQGFGMAAVLIDPPSTRFIAADGFSRQDVIDYLFEKTKRTVVEWEEWWYRASARPGVPRTRLAEYIREGTIPQEVLDKPNERLVPLVAHPSQLKVFVCGDQSKEKTMALYGWYVRPSTAKVLVPPDGRAMRREGRESDLTTAEVSGVRSQKVAL